MIIHVPANHRTVQIIGRRHRLHLRTPLSPSLVLGISISSSISHCRPTPLQPSYIVNATQMVGICAVLTSFLMPGATSTPPGFLSFPLHRHSQNLSSEVTTISTTRRLLVDTSRRLAENFGTELSLQYGLGTHYTEIYVGSPPQRVSVIADTGKPKYKAWWCVPA